MNSIINLMALVGDQKTLIITAEKHTENTYLGIFDEISIFNLPDNLLHRCDAKQKARLQNAIDDSQCTQIIFLGMLDEEMEHFLMYSSSLHGIRSGLRFQTPLLPTNEKIITHHDRTFALLEQHVMNQCNHLMDCYFIREKIKEGQIRVLGIVGSSETETFNTVFTNGVRFNDRTSMN